MDKHLTSLRRISLVWILACLLLLRVRQCGTLDLTGKQAAQSSTLYNKYHAFQAIDGNDESISATVNEVQPWWRVDLGEAYCLKKISLKIRIDCCADRLDLATVRAGFSTDHYHNRVIGPRVSVTASSLGALLPIVSSPLNTDPEAEVTVLGGESCDDTGGRGGGDLSNILTALVIVIGIGVFLLGIGVVVVSLLYRRYHSRTSVNPMVTSQFVSRVDSTSTELDPIFDTPIYKLPGQM